MNCSIEDYKLLAKHLWKPSLINHPIIQADSFLSVQMDAFTVYRYAWENHSVLLVVAARPVLEGCNIYQQSDTDTLAHLAVLQYTDEMIYVADYSGVWAKLTMG